MNITKVLLLALPETVHCLLSVSGFTSTVTVLGYPEAKLKEPYHTYIYIEFIIKIV